MWCDMSMSVIDFPLLMALIIGDAMLLKQACSYEHRLSTDIESAKNDISTTCIYRGERVAELTPVEILASVVFFLPILVTILVTGLEIATIVDQLHQSEILLHFSSGAKHHL